MAVLADSGGAAIGGLFFFLIYIAIFVLYVAGMWKVFEKAGQKGWMAIIPILNWYVLIKIAGREGWWVILLFIPCVNIVVLALVSLDVARAFGKTTGYGIGLWILGVIFYPMLGFGDSQYQGPPLAPIL
jgi:hypothetical protein